MNKRTVVLCSIASAVLTALGLQSQAQIGDVAFLPGLMFGFIAYEEVSDFLRKRNEIWNKRVTYIQISCLVGFVLAYPGSLIMRYFKTLYADELHIASIVFLYVGMGYFWQRN